jgi:death-on-curing protein
MAAAYLFHLAKNHAFVDGNKRGAAAAMIMFVYLNDHDLDCDEDDLVELTVGVAAGTTTKADVAVFLAARMSR